MLHVRTLIASLIGLSPALLAQETDVTQAPNAAGAGIKKSLAEEIGLGRGDGFTPDTSIYLIRRDPFRSIARGRQLFQRKFTLAQGLGPRTGDGVGDIESEGSIGAGLADSCAACHGRPQGSAGFGGDVFTRPTSRDAPHLFGLGLVEMLADEITRELRAQRALAEADAASLGVAVSVPLASKGISYGSLTAFPDGSVDLGDVEGVDADLRVRPFFAEGSTISIREFVVGALNAEMGLEAHDPDLLAAAAGADVVTPSGMLLSGSVDRIEAPPVASAVEDGDGDGAVDEVPASLIDAFEFYLLNYFRPGLRAPDASLLDRSRGARFFRLIGCAECHVQDLTLDVDRRVADVDTLMDPARGNAFNNLYATASTLHDTVDDGSGHPALKPPLGGGFVVERIFADFKRHDLGPAFWERNFDGSIQKEFLTEPLWGVGSTAPYGHDGRSPTLRDVILRHGGEATAARDLFASLDHRRQESVIDFLQALVLFSPPSTSSNLNEADPGVADYPLEGHGSIDLSALFLDPADKE